jgi:hypothetical protein
LTGKGIVRIGENEPKQNHCVKVRELFGWKIVSIESEFDEGFTTQVIAFTTHLNREPKLGVNQIAHCTYKDHLIVSGHNVNPTSK